MNLPIRSQRAQLRTVFNNFLSLSAVQWANYLLPLLLIPYLVKTLKLESYGIVVFAQSLMVFFHLLIDFGFDYSAAKVVALNRSKTRFLSEIYWTVVYVKLILIILSSLALSLILYIFGDQMPGASIIYWFSFLAITCQALVPNWFFQGVEDMKYVALFNLSARALYFVSIFFIVTTAEDYQLVPLLNFLAFLIVFVISIIFVNFRYKIFFFVPSKSSITAQIKESSHFFYARFMGNIASASGVVVLGLFLSSESVGIYSIAEKIMKAYQGAASSASRAIYPFMSRKQIFEKYKQFIKFPIIINAVFLAILYFFAEDIFYLIFSGNSSNAFEIFQIFIFALMFSVPSIFIGYPLLGAGKSYRVVNNSTIIGVFIFLVIICCLVITQKISLFNLAYSLLAMEILIFLYRAFFVLKKAYL